MTQHAPSLSYEIPQGVLATVAPSEKDETIGLLLSIIITGGGHFYAGETGTGLVLLAANVGGVVVGAALSDGGNDAPAFIGLGVALAAYIYGIVDGRKAVQRYNAANGFALAPTILGVGGEASPALSMRVRL